MVQRTRSRNCPQYILRGVFQLHYAQHHKRFQDIIALGTFYVLHPISPFLGGGGAAGRRGGGRD